MSPKTARQTPVLKQTSLQFGSRKSGKIAAGGKHKPSAGSVETTTTTSQPKAATPDVHVISPDGSDIEEFLAPELDMTEDPVEEAEAAPVMSLERERHGSAKKGREKEVDETEGIEEEQPPKKKRRATSRSARASIETPVEDDSLTMTKKGRKTKTTRARKGVFKSREGAENSESVEEESWVEASKQTKLTTKDKKVAKHVDLAAMRQHFGFVREKMGNVKPIHAATQSMEDHILRFFDLSYEFGPCIGVTRLQRWDRADALGLDPPEVVKQLLTNEDGSERTEVKECVFYGDV